MTIEQSETPDSGHLSRRWHIATFFFMLALGAFLLWGVYQPLMRHYSNRHLSRGNLFMQHGVYFADDHDSDVKNLLNNFEIKILTIYEAQKSNERWIAREGVADAGLPAFREMVERYASLAPVMMELNDQARSLLQMTGQMENFGYLLDEMTRKIRMGLPRIKHLEENFKGSFSARDAHRDCDYLGYAVVPDFLEAARHIQSLFDRESSFDIAMMEYMAAIAFSRNWSLPRLRMVELYHHRGWPEFAMLECLKTIKLDPNGADGRRAQEILLSYDDKHPEADYYIGILRLMQGDRGEGERLLRRFVAQHPTIPNAPKAWNLLTHMDRGHEAFVKHFLRDEIWL